MDKKETCFLYISGDMYANEVFEKTLMKKNFMKKWLSRG